MHATSATNANETSNLNRRLRNLRFRKFHLSMDMVSLFPLGLAILDWAAVAFHSNEDGFAANISLAATVRVNFIVFSQNRHRSSSFEQQIAIRTCLRYNPARCCS